MAHRFKVKLLFFITPVLIMMIAACFLIARTGEILPVRLVASIQSYLQKPSLFMPEYSDHLYRYKIDVTLSRKPDILVMSSSRGNQWRSGMFKGLSFYNAGNSMYLPEDYINALNDIAPYTPRVLIVTIDAWMFDEAFAKVVEARSKTDISGWDELRYLAGKTSSHFVVDPSSIKISYVEPNYGLPALGMYAIRMGLGFRWDGSVQYGDVIANDQPRTDPLSAAKQIGAGNAPWPALPANTMASQFRQSFEAFARLAAEKKIKVVAVTPGIFPDVVDALDVSSEQGAWREFRTEATRKWIEGLGILYFDFTEISSYGGHADEFVDGFHPSEPAYLRMLMTMVGDRRFAELVPGIGKADLREVLSQATRYEAYRNHF